MALRTECTDCGRYWGRVHPLGESCPASSYSGPVAAGNQGDKGAMDRYQEHQERHEDKRKYGVQ